MPSASLWRWTPSWLSWFPSAAVSLYLRLRAGLSRDAEEMQMETKTEKENEKLRQKARQKAMEKWKAEDRRRSQSQRRGSSEPAVHR